MTADYIETHLAKHEYIEGPDAAERFVKMAIKVFRAPKSSAKPVPKKSCYS